MTSGDRSGDKVTSQDPRSPKDMLADHEAIKWASSFIERFEKPKGKLYEWHEMKKQPDGSWILGWCEYSKDVTAFIEGLYQKNLAVVFDWGSWSRGRKLTDQFQLIAKASGEDCLKLITALIRQDRFSEGSLGVALDKGIIVACLKRLGDLNQAQGNKR